MGSQCGLDQPLGDIQFGRGWRSIPDHFVDLCIKQALNQAVTAQKKSVAWLQIDRPDLRLDELVIGT